MLDLLSRQKLNVEQMQNRVFEGGEAAVATIDVGGNVGADLIDELRALDHVISVSVTTL